MPQSDRISGTRNPRWPVVVLVVAAISAASLALGLLVVGPMMQRRGETPPAALSTSGTTSVSPVRLAAPAADVAISERIIRRPPPRPAPPPVTDSLDVPLSAPPGDESASEMRSGVTAPARPAIHATVTDANGAEFGTDSAPARSSRMARRHPASRTASGATNDGTSGLDPVRGQDGEARPRAAPAPRARTPRASPLDALPPLDADGPETKSPAAAGASTAPDRESPPGGRSYRVQVGRFEDEGEAARLRDELKKSGLSPRVVRTEREGKATYRVQVGTFRQRENADRQIEKLKSQSYDPYLADEAP